MFNLEKPILIIFDTGLQFSTITKPVKNYMLLRICFCNAYRPIYKFIHQKSREATYEKTYKA